MSIRISAVNDAPLATRGAYVLYWMIAARRTTWSFALDHAIECARALGRQPLVFRTASAIERIDDQEAADEQVPQPIPVQSTPWRRRGARYL